MTHVDPTQLRNADGSELSAEQLAALTGTPAPPPAAPPVEEPPAGPSLAEKELAVAKAGFTITDPLISTLARAYDGELTAEAIAAYFAALGQTPAGTTPPGAPPAGDPVPVAGGQGDARQGLAGAEFVPQAPPAKGAYERMADEVQRVRDEGYDEETQLQVAFQELAQRALEGDDSVSVEARHGQRTARWQELGRVSNTQ